MSTLRPLLTILLLAVSIRAVSAGELEADLQARGKADEEGLEAFARASELWGQGIEAYIEEAYRQCFRTFNVGGRFVTLRMPFAQNNERSELTPGDLEVLGGGKAAPPVLWNEIASLLESADFKAYAAILSDGKEKIVSFDLETRSWKVERDWFSIVRMKAGAYPGFPHKPSVLADGRGLQAPDIYNYVYCVGRLGIDCSGFVWHALSRLALAAGIDLEREMRRAARASRSERMSLYVGTWLFDPRAGSFAQVRDRIADLRPGDVILFRNEEGVPVHSAIVQSIDREAGRIRYLQSTDEAPQEERGVHESFILFDPSLPETSLRDPSIVWRQERASPFAGEMVPPFRNDGERYRAFGERGGGIVVRLKSMEKLVASLGLVKPQ